MKKDQSNNTNLNENLNNSIPYYEEELFIYPDGYDAPIIPDYAWEYLQEQEDIYIYEETKEDIEKQKVIDEAIKQAQLEEEERREKELDEYHFKQEYEEDKIYSILYPDKQKKYIKKKLFTPPGDEELKQILEEQEQKDLDKLYNTIYKEETTPDNAPVDTPVVIDDAPIEDALIEDVIFNKLDGLFNKDFIYEEPTPELKTTAKVDNNFVDVELFDINYDNNKKLKLNKRCYKSDALIESTDYMNKAVEIITKNFKDKMSNYVDYTDEDDYFIRETTKCIYGKPKSDKPVVVARKCGGGKSVGISLIIDYQIEQIKQGITNSGIIVVSEQLDNLRDMYNRLFDDNKKYAIVIESCNKEVCINNQFKNVKKENLYKYRFKCNCNECKIKRQFEEQAYYPILFLTTARMDLMLESLDKYATWERDGNKYQRTLLLIDERPIMIKPEMVSREEVNTINTRVSKLTIDSIEEKTELLDFVEEIRSKVVTIMDTNRKDDARTVRKVIKSNDSAMTSNDERFWELWNKHMGINCKTEIETIQKLLTDKAVYVQSKNVDYIALIQNRNVLEQFTKFKTIIFDATALIDTSYNRYNMNFLYLQDSETYENLTIRFRGNYSVSKHKINRNYYKIDGTKYNKVIDKLNSYLNSLKLTQEGECYVVTYKDVCQMINIKEEKQKYFALDSDKELSDIDIDVYDKKGNKIEGLKQEKERKFSYHINATKGKNSMRNAVKMVLFGLNRMSDYQTLLAYMSSLTNTELDMMVNKVISGDESAIKDFNDNSIYDYRNIEDYSLCNTSTANGNTKRWYYSLDDYYKKNDKVKLRFGIQELNEFDYLRYAVELTQEIFRTALRLHDKSIAVEVEVWGYDDVIAKMLQSIFKSCKVEFDTTLPLEFITTQENSNADKIVNFMLSCMRNNIKEFKISQAREYTELSSKQFQKAVEENKGLDNWFKDEANKGSKKGYYKLPDTTTDKDTTTTE